MRKITTYLLALVLSTTSLLSFAQKSVSGRVTDAEDGKPLPGATIKAGEIRGTSTDKDGHFVLKNISDNIDALDISYIGYQTSKVAIGAANQLEIKLNKSTYQADEVIINATRVNDKTGMAYTNVTAAQIDKQNMGQDLPVLLNFSPSLVSTSDAGGGVGYTGIRIRGSDATRINVTVNGIPYNDAESQGVFWVNMPDFTSSVSSIQIQRGVGTSTNGAGAFGASVNINTNAFRETAYAELNNSYGSFNTFKNTLKVGSGLIKDKFTFDARLSRVSSDGFVDRASSELHSYYLSGGYFGKKSFVRVNVFSGKERTYQSWNGVPEAKLRGDREGILAYIDRNYLGEKDAQNLLNSDNRTYNSYTYKNEVDNYRQDHYQIVSSHNLSNKLTFNLNAFLVRGLGYYEQYRSGDDYSKYNLPNVIVGKDTLTSTDFIRRRWLDNYFYGSTFSFDYNSFKKLTTSFGGGWNQYDGDHYGQIIWARNAGNIENEHQYYFSTGKKKDFNLYGKVYYAFTDRLTAFADLQYRRVSHAIHGTDNDLVQLAFDQSYSFFNPKAGITYQLAEQSSVYASYSIGNREPNRDDFTSSTANLFPKSERLQNVEAGFRTQQGKWAFAANYYLMSYKNQLVLTGQINDVGGSVRVNVPKSYRTGIELEGAVVFNSHLKWNANATFSQNKIKNFTEYIVDYDNGGYKTVDHGKSDISFSPNVIVGSQFTYSLRKNLELALLTKYVGKQYLDNTSTETRKLDAYLTNDIRLSWTIKPSWANEIAFNLLVNNVLDEKYESNGYTYGYIAGGALTQENFYFPQAGRNFLIGVNFRF
ncbi:iron complex outermembrane receptor protein [Dyadobacter sp. BE34]|uniref:Iron complex outermembrane receptor protein n=1 Tax=Dyadobacter fermentans TaxID=94254 RepID=A0ABU1R2F0_9BACT|nr:MULTISPECIES: TonB-dependent receptor [Dyadobacter]MDR6807604.1 iron complex outermembrane receptor protein [Dyadobacter fermentans]MDR7045345.1 iron complex outermembrane receptor protein [Dyadobacter sp. BE242]MDR7199658.1 iron complex outermembrane receptor protein [Dyadobacter sp. BE34]MDR7217883.1 iron complex outermembrane receptor protein [Dyadobacter sp. BE31]MDR7265549.1 iron complex outermembrane receptor protein [Dyadobacter sp. BE32]